MPEHKPMSGEPSAAISSVLEVIAEVGFTDSTYDPDTERIQIPMDMGGGRRQRVLIECSGVTPRGDQMICIISGCLLLDTPEAIRLVEKHWGTEGAMCQCLLERNSSRGYGKFALATFGESRMVVICCEQLLPTMDAAELDAMVHYVATRADSFELSIGTDDY